MRLEYRENNSLIEYFDNLFKSSDNYSGQIDESLSHAPILTSSSVTRSFVLFLIAFWSLVGNAITLQNAGKQQKARTQISRIYVLIRQLSVADIFVTLFCIVGESLWMLTVSWRADTILCKLFKFIQMFSLYLSTFIMILIGIDRFFSVRYPLKVITKEIYRRIIICCWTLSALLSLPQLYIFRVVQAPFQEPFYQCVSFGAYSEPWQEKFYAIFSITTIFVIPLIVLMSTYILTVCTLHKTEEVLTEIPVFKTQFNPKRKEIIHRAKINSLRLSITIIVTFLVCWMPYHIMMIISIFTELFEEYDNSSPTNNEIEKSPLLEWITNFGFFFGMSNSLFNPIIYGIFLLWNSKDNQNSSDENIKSQDTPHNCRNEPTRNGRLGKSKRRVLINTNTNGRKPLSHTNLNQNNLGPNNDHYQQQNNEETNNPGYSRSSHSDNAECDRELEQWFQKIRLNPHGGKKTLGGSFLSLKSFSMGSGSSNTHRARRKLTELEFAEISKKFKPNENSV